MGVSISRSLGEMVKTFMQIAPQEVGNGDIKKGSGINRAGSESAFFECFVGAITGSPTAGSGVKFEVQEADSDTDSAYATIDVGLPTEKSWTAVATDGGTHKGKITVNNAQDQKVWLRLKCTATLLTGSTPKAMIGGSAVIAGWKETPVTDANS